MYSFRLYWMIGGKSVLKMADFWFFSFLLEEREATNLIKTSHFGSNRTAFLEHILNI